MPGGNGLASGIGLVSLAPFFAQPNTPGKPNCFRVLAIDIPDPSALA
jgi:hypothetical protein